jgi:capsular polysaccharide biosynthesis protein
MEQIVSSQQHMGCVQSVSNVFCQKTFVPIGTLCGEAQTKCIEELQKTFDSTLGKYENDHKKILIVLQKREKRKIINHEELLEALQTRFSSCCGVEASDGTESLAENVARHRKAHIIIGPHGAGLSSAIFAHRGSSGMVELHPQKGNWFGK